jgi:hypothetical protein
LLFDRDLKGAAKRWTADTIYARKRLVNTRDPRSGVLGSVAVSISDPLVVDSVGPGHSPIPPYPLWVHVRTAAGQSGFIPTRYSHTNSSAATSRDSAAWCEDLLEYNPRSRWQWEEHIWQSIDSHNATTGMTTAQVRLAWSSPPAADSIVHEGSAALRWSFPAQHLLFFNDTLQIILPRG